jgi:hypothetical protein
MKSALFAAAAGAVITTAAGAHAASIDCARPATPMETKICTVPGVSKADDDLAIAFKTALGQVSPDGQAALRSSERSFLVYANSLCRPSQMPLDSFQWQRMKDPHPDLSANCLEDAFKTRTEILRRAVVRLGQHVFLSTTTYRVHAYTPTGDTLPTAAARQILTLAQIDAPDAAGVGWNAEVRKRFEGTFDSLVGQNDGQVSPDKSSVDLTIRVTAAAPGAIVANIDAATDSDGMAHPESSAATFTWLLAAGRQLKLGDLFDPSKPWATALAPVAQSHLKSLTEPPQTQFDTIKTIDGSGSWRILPDGLHIDYDPYVLGGYLSAATTTLSWAELKPYLRGDLPFDPAQIDVAPHN